MTGDLFLPGSVPPPVASKHQPDARRDRTMTTVKEDLKNTAAPWQCWAWSVGSPVVGALVVWGVSRLGAVDLTVGSGDQRRTVGVLSVLVASALAGLAGTSL